MHRSKKQPVPGNPVERLDLKALQDARSQAAVVGDHGSGANQRVEVNPLHLLNTLHLQLPASASVVSTRLTQLMPAALSIQPKLKPALDPDFVPAALWNRAYQSLVTADPGKRAIAIALIQSDTSASRYDTTVLAAGHSGAELTLRYVERLLKFLLWQKGGSRVLIAGAPEIVADLARIYAPGGARAFDAEFMGQRIYSRPFSIEAVSIDALPAIQTSDLAAGRNLDGCRIGFDLGGSDRKAAALIDGQVVYSEEIAWDPYFQSDPAYHLEGVHDSLTRAAAHLPRVDAIGGSAAGVYVNNEVRAASLFRGVSPENFEQHIRRMFSTLQTRWGGIPFEVVNDGEVTALAGSMSLGQNAVLGISMGTSQAGGYVTPAGGITSWLNELAFTPIDYRADAPRDEWSGDLGCGVQFFSQQGVDRFARLAGFVFPAELPLAERLIQVQEALAKHDPRAHAVFESIGICFGYALAHYAAFYEIRHVLVLGRVTSHEGGALILANARKVLEVEFPELAAKLALHLPDEKEKRHGQAIAAASLPRINSPKSTP